uniref:F-box domain-containing protein n=1 Tax=Caenorhabditis tropicalis TaxID=1561998 RepID=A0A1I7UDW1_9PELO
MPFLLDMPDLAMSKILDHLEFQSILSFQKVSRNVYDYVNDKKPDLKLKKIEIDMEPSRVTVILKCHSQKKPIRIRYQDHVFGCQVSFENRITVVEDASFLNVFYRDILQYAQHQKSILKEFSLKAQRVPEEIKGVLSFKAKKVTVSTSCQKDILDILSCFGDLSSISVYNIGENSRWTLDDRWMTSGQSLIVRGFQFDIPVTRICHYDNIDIWMTEVSARDLWFLKEVSGIIKS